MADHFLAIKLHSIYTKMVHTQSAFKLKILLANTLFLPIYFLVN